MGKASHNWLGESVSYDGATNQSVRDGPVNQLWGSEQVNGGAASQLSWANESISQ